MRANLHLHSRFSDGTIWPADIAARASSANLQAVALTDHDTLSGTNEFVETGRSLGLSVVPGVEIDCREPSIAYKSELLAYFPAGRFAWTSSFLDEIKKERIRSTKRALELASGYFGIASLSFPTLTERRRAERTELSPEDFSFNKVDVYLYLKDAGAVPPEMDYKTFKKAYFDTRILSNGGRDKPLCSEVAGIVERDGGFLVIPHIGHEFDDDPDRMKREKTRLETILSYFKSIGAAGVELYQYRNERTEALNRLVKKAAKPLGYFFTYGSDCHGPGSGKDTIGEFYGRFKGFPKR